MANETSRYVRIRLEQLRRERGLTLKDLSARLNAFGRPMSLSTLSKIANGDRRVDVDDLVALACVLGVPPNEIILPAGAWSETGSADVLVSYIDTDEAWAAWIGAQLEAVGQRTRLQVTPSPVSENVIAWFSQQVQTVTRIIAVCSAPYLRSHWCTSEWDGAMAGRAVIPLRVADCTLPPVLAAIGSRDLYGVDEPTARHRLLEAIGSAGTRATSARFPGGTLAGAAGTIPDPGRQPVIWNVQPQLATFTGRKDQLDQIKAGLSNGAPVVVHGLGGVGKTHLAVEYCYRNGRDYDLVWWVPAEEPGLVGSLEELAEQAGVAVVGDAKESARAVVEQLRAGNGGRFARWLVVLDNAGAPSDSPEVSRLLGAAKASGGHILVTSRDPSWSRLATPVDVDVLPRDEAVHLLRTRAQGLSAEQAGRLAKALGDLPLALEQAGAWLAESGMPADTYEDLLQRRTREVLTRGTAASQVPVAATWTVALDAVVDPAAVMLVRLWAHLGPEPIPLDLLSAEVAERVPDPLATAARDPLKLGDTITQVSKLGLVRLTGDTVVMHRLVQAVLRDHTPAEERELLRTAVAQLVAAATTGDPKSQENRHRYARLCPHALAADLISNSDPDDPDVRAAVIRFVDYLDTLEDYTNFRRLVSQARDQWKETLGEDHPDTLVATGQLAYMLRKQSDFLNAQVLLEDVLSRCQRTLGRDHRHTTKAEACLGATLRGKGDYPAARRLFEDMLSRCQRALGNDHLDTIRAAVNLAATLRKQGDYPAARKLFEDVLSRRRRKLGDDHLDTIKAAASLATTLRDQGDYPAARKLFEDVLSRLRRILGNDHSYTTRLQKALEDLVVPRHDPVT